MAKCCPRSCKMGRDVAALLSLKLTARRTQRKCSPSLWSSVEIDPQKKNVGNQDSKDLKVGDLWALGPNSACCQSKKANLLSHHSAVTQSGLLLFSSHDLVAKLQPALHLAAKPGRESPWSPWRKSMKICGVKMRKAWWLMQKKLAALRVPICSNECMNHQV